MIGAGHDSIFARDVFSGFADHRIADSSPRQGRIIVTQDLDFGELVFRDRLVVAGVILIEPSGLTAADHPALVLQAVKELASDLLGHFARLSSSRRRVRPLS